MAKKTFISYKFSDAQHTRDAIIDALGEDARFYQGETSDSPDLTAEKAEAIKEVLKDMIHGTSVTIVVLSPSVTASNWVDWEVKYSLRETTRGDRTSRRNGVVGVIQKNDGGYEWLTSNNYCAHNDRTNKQHDNSKMHAVVHKNRFNQTPLEYLCIDCKTVDRLGGSYISLIPEDEFLKDPNTYIENAWNKSQSLDSYSIKIDV